MINFDLKYDLNREKLNVLIASYAGLDMTPDP